MFKISRKKNILRLSILSSVIISIIALVAFYVLNSRDDSQAVTTTDGSIVAVTRNDTDLKYGTWQTHRYQVTSAEGTYTGYCAQPSKGDPSGSHTAHLMDTNDILNKAIRYILFLHQHSTNDYRLNEEYNSIFGPIINDSNWGTSESNRAYVFAHVIAGYFYQDSLKGLTSSMQTQLDTAIILVDSFAHNNSIGWKMSQHYSLFKATGTGQDIVWIESNPIVGDLYVFKVDEETGSRAPQGNGSFAGITIQVYNASGEEIYDPIKNVFISPNGLVATGQLASDGSLVFRNLPAEVALRIKEAEDFEDDSYYHSAPEQTFTLPTAGMEIILPNRIKKGKLTINKTDSGTGTCTTSSSSLSYAGITFQIINNSTNPVDYNNNSIARGQVVDTKSFSAGTCSISFDNLPYGSYIVKETSTSSGYELNTATQTVSIPTNKNYNISINFANTPKYGSITVNKIDSRTRVCATSSNAINYNGVTLQLINNTSGTVYYHGRAIARGGVIDTRTLGANTCNVKFDNLPHGSYIIKETAASYGYNVNTATKTVNIPTDSNYNLSTNFENIPILGNITVNKIDKETGTCTTVTNKHSFAGTTFQLINNTGGNVYYNNTFIAQGAVIATRTMTAGSCNVVFEGLPYGNYQIKETAAGARYALDSEPKPVSIPTNNQANVSYTFSNQPIRGDLVFVKRDPANNNIPMENAYFSISSIDENNNVMETHIVVSNNQGIVDTRSSFAPHSFHTNGYDELYDSSEVPMVFSGYGTWFGLNRNGQPVRPVNDNVGALPYGTYLIQELRCDANMFCSGIINEKVTIQITSHNQVVNLGYWDNTCAQFSIETEATDQEDSDHYIEESENSVIKDHISYCAKKNYTFTIVGTLMDKETGEPLNINGQTFTQTAEVKPTTDCGTLDMEFPVNTTDLAGKSIVVFEKLYYKESLKTTHEDINDENQTIHIVKLGTIATDKNDDDHFIVEGESTIIKDTVSYCAKKDTSIVIKGVLMDKETGNPLLIDDEVIESSVELTPTEDCGTTELEFEIPNTTGLAGKAIVAYETLYEKVSDTEEHEIVSHKDLNDENQTVTVINLRTFAVNEQTGNKLFPRDTDVTVKDHVYYCLQPGKEYTVKGVVMDKDTGNGLLVNSAPVESSVTFTPTEPCGETEMNFSFNTTNLGGAKLVVFESLYYNDELLIDHKDINNEDESFEIDINAPETGYAAKVSSGTTETTHTELLVIAAFAITPAIIYSASHLFSKRKITFNK